MNSLKYNNYIEIRVIVLLTFLLSIIATQAMRNQFFYINWILGGLLIFVYLISMLSKQYISKDLIKTWLIMSMWLVVPIVISVDSSLLTDRYLHFSRMFVFLFYVTVCAILVHQVFKVGIKNRDSVFYYSNIIWITINLIVLLLFLFFDVNLGGRSDFSGIVDNRNTFAIITTFLSSYLIFYGGNYKGRKITSLLLITSFLLVVFTLSVKGVVGWALIFIVANFKNIRLKNKLSKPRTVLLLILACILFAIFTVTDNPIKERIERFTMVLTEPEELGKNESAYLRTYFLKEGWEVFKKHPLSGVGINHSRYYLISPKDLASGAQVGTYSHNNYMEILLNGGLISFLLYYAPFIIILIYLKKKKNTMTLAHYLYGLSLYKLFIDFGSVSYDVIVMNFILAFIVYGYFQLKRHEKTLHHSPKGV